MIATYYVRERSIKIINQFQIEAIPPSVSEYPIFNENMLNNIINRTVIAYSDASVDAG